MDWPKIEDLEYAECRNVEDVLGAAVVEDGILFRCFFPEADKVLIKIKGKSRTVIMKKMDDCGYFAALMVGKKIPEYTYQVQYKTGKMEIIDSYATDHFVDAMDEVMFAGGEHDKIYEKLGAHPGHVAGYAGTWFAVWAPNAVSVSVVGDFNNWDGRLHPMRRLESGIFELFVPEVGDGDIYKYEVHGYDGKTVMKADPYGFYAEKRPASASIVWSIDEFEWQDADWLKKRKQTNWKKEPIVIYEMHLGSFEKPMGGGFYTYRELADKTAEYCKKMGYTHVELMPVMEHPLDASWGYQVIGYYAPTSRYGTPEDFMYFVDSLHQAGIGVILDWVPAHFPKDEHGLGRFDGTALYEHEDPKRGEHPHWGTYIYNYGRNEVRNFLVANALYWAEKYHIDGIRIDAVASMLYLDYGRGDGEWLPNIYGGNENLEAIDFIKELNSKMHELHKGVIMIAEESTAWPMMTHPVEAGGLGFDYKWNMGWMNDFLNYMKLDPLYRKYHHNDLTFSMVYAYSEKFILVLSHDEVVHEKGSMIAKMPGGYEDKFSNLRVAYGYMMTHPGKKLLFMGQEIAQFTEFNENAEVDWSLFEFDAHVFMQGYVKELNELYKTEPALYELDSSPEGFTWINCNSANTSLLSYVRKGKKESDTLLIICNFTPMEHKAYKLATPSGGRWQEIFSSDNNRYGGEGRNNKTVKQAKKAECDGQEHYISVTVPPLSISVFKKKIGK